MNKHLQHILDFINQSENISAEEKGLLIKATKAADSDLAISDFKLERTEKVKRTTAILLEETIQELEQKRKAVEAQNRELEIETALERVRSRTMAMQHSSELGDTSFLLDSQVRSLGVKTWGCAFHIYGENESSEWFASEAGVMPAYHIPWEGFFLRYYEAGQNGQSLYIEEFAGEKCLAHYEYLCTIPVVGEALLKIKESGGSFPGFQIDHVAFFKQGYLLFITLEPVPQAHEIFKRFAKVFEQTYTRFLDLQKAELQAREGQIEASLERVRSKTMAMHNSQDVADTVATMLDELVMLGVETIRCGIGIMNEDMQMEAWTAKSNDQRKADLVIGKLDMSQHPLLSGAYNGWKNKKEHFNYELTGEDLISYYNVINNHADYPIKYEISSLPPRISHNDFYFSEGSLYVFSLSPLSAEAIKIFKRFAGVFGQTYRRYLDLQKAEAQAREAQIEAALERVRGKAMAMHNSNDLSVTASLVFTELRKLGISPIRCGVGLLNKESRRSQLYSATSSADADSLSLVGWVVLSGHPVLENIYDYWLKNQDYYPELEGEQLRSYYELLLAGLSVAVPDPKTGKKQYGHFLPLSIGCLYAWSDSPYNETEIKILKRFGSIIDLTFRRYIELQTSEANAREAVKQAALDRIRADIASMRTKTDLERITPLIWNELTILGVNFIRCGVFIMDDSQQLIHTFLSTPEGKAIAAFHIPYITPGNVSQVLHHWQRKESYIDHWNETAFSEFANALIKLGALDSTEQYLKTIPHGGFYLHFLPFQQGMLYVGNSVQLAGEEIKLTQSLADAFSTAYARYEDFNKLEAAKQQVEKALVDLKQAQTQLVQSEKMASLGELTAGIAHEIQNPLNFVNNFSEVSKELLDEMKAELNSGNTEAAKGIADDIIGNLEKINHHGKRADAIVKGMLQHSSTGSGVKELTDINPLIDEYIRLCFLGIRTKDKSFNANVKTNLDSSLGEINVIPQDIGRAFLNLLTNAFYAVNERKKQQTDNYEPTVTVATQRMKSLSTAGKPQVLISVTDNGNGIPQKILDKIFQPFFTTKPTGQGTGLGLSLAYDIITKGHNGELKVETKEGEGSEFIIQLPV